MRTPPACWCGLEMVVLALPLLAAAPAWAQSCQPFWADAGVGLPGYLTDDSMKVFDDGTGPALYAVVDPPGQSDFIYKWNGQIWTNVSQGLPTGEGSRFIGLKTLDDGSGPKLFAFIWFPGQGNGTFHGRWRIGSEWIPTPAGFMAADGSAAPLVSCDLGNGTETFGVVRVSIGRYKIAKWTNSGWDNISGEFSVYGFKLMAFDDGAGPRLYAVGPPGTIGGVSFRGFARWVGGTEWERPPSNHWALGDIYDVAAYDDGNGPAIYAFGYIYLDQHGSEIPGVGRWDGQTWINLGGPVILPNTIYTRSKIEVFDDGSGPALYVTGGFGNWGGVPARGIAKWNGQTWAAVGEGVGPGSEVTAMEVGPGPYGPTLFIGGGLNRASVGTIHGIAQWVGCPNCYANCDQSTVPPVLNVSDFICFLNKFVVKDPYSNCDNDAAINATDFLCFLNKFAAGCP